MVAHRLLGQFLLIKHGTPYTNRVLVREKRTSRRCSCACVVLSLVCRLPDSRGQLAACGAGLRGGRVRLTSIDFSGASRHRRREVTPNDFDMKKDIDTLIAEERAEIISKYDKGRQEGVKIDPWEDADYSIFKVTDRFGFLHEEELPTPSALEEKQKQQEIERVEKWLKMVKNWDKYRNSEKLTKRVYKGIPLQLRGQAWALLLDIEKVRKDNDGKYEKMKQQARNFSTEIKQIDLDVNRTFRNHIMFMDRFGVKQQALFHVLAAYSVYNTEVSYCQGAGQIAILLMPEWGRCLLGSVPAPPGMKSMHSADEADDVGIYTTKWFLQCFIDSQSGELPKGMPLGQRDQLPYCAAAWLSSGGQKSVVVHTQRSTLPQGLIEHLHYLKTDKPCAGVGLVRDVKEPLPRCSQAEDGENQLPPQSRPSSQSLSSRHQKVQETGSLNTSQYDNLSEVDEDDRTWRLLGSHS
ncbi:USP6 N-terminal-like protein [Lates japonicus]|uniref:USP6 N-terminal-like protein n=1 Tax=Lates japonicus TaxID=270547 RepID=A0AAD3MVC5_LATJO|nr:USP6 N-terminal-like protein [Lates japonicus]